jgi:hypothetical protein
MNSFMFVLKIIFIKSYRQHVINCVKEEEIILPRMT